MYVYYRDYRTYENLKAASVSGPGGPATEYE